MGSPLLFALLVGLSIFIGFFAMWRLLAANSPLDARLAQYGVTSELAEAGGMSTRSSAYALSRSRRIMAGFGTGPHLAARLSRADIPLTAAEFILIVAGAAALGFGLGAWGGGPLLGLGLGAVAAALPFMWLSMKESRRRKQLTEQLPELLTLLVGGLRAGYGLGQAVEAAYVQLPAPTSVEIGRVMRATSLGLPLQKALSNMADRVGSDEMYLVATAMAVQYELGGNLAQTLDIIADTVRERIRIRREIQVFTSQQRLTGYILAVLPVAMAVLLYFLNPDYIKQLFQPGIMRIVLIAGILMQIAGFLIIRKIVDIEV